MSLAKHKVFISYHHDDQNEVDRFVTAFDYQRQVFISRALGMTQDIIDSSDTDLNKGDYIFSHTGG